MHSCQLHVLVTGVNDSAFRLICETCTRSQRIKLAPEQAIFLFVNKGTLPPTVAALQEVYDQCKDDDGFLYMTYSGENTFGDPARCDTGGEVGARGAA